jgi:hypothetical protein
MTRFRAARLLTAAGLALGILMASTATAAPVQSSTQFFLRQDGCGTTSEAGRLSVESGKDTSDGCGWPGGVPLDEVFYEVDGEVLEAFDYATVDGMPLVLDAARRAEGVISTRGNIPVAGRGVGEVTVDVTLTGTRIGTNGRPQTVTLGAGTFSATALPTTNVYSVPFQLDLAAAQQGVEFRSMNMTVALRGKNVGASAQSLSGTSYVHVPTLVEDEVDAG